jgi:hypothetical protein
MGKRGYGIKNSEMKDATYHSRANNSISMPLIFFHPDCTVGFGILAYGTAKVP